MNEKQMSLEDVHARIKRMHAELNELEKLLTESIWKKDMKWQFPESNYTVLAIWLLYDPRAWRMFAVNERKSWVELAERLTKYVEWTVYFRDSDVVRFNKAKQSLYRHRGVCKLFSFHIYVRFF